MKYPHNWKSPDLSTCEWCGDKDWMASDSCSKNPDFIKKHNGAMNIADLKRARDVGATHNLRGRLIKGAYLDDVAYEFNEESNEWVLMEFYKSPVLHASAWSDCKIDFTPLNNKPA